MRSASSSGWGRSRSGRSGRYSGTIPPASTVSSGRRPSPGRRPAGLRPDGQRLGVIGAGNIGGAIAMNLVADGHRVVVHDPDARRCGPLVAAGATVAGSPAEVAERSEITFTSLPTPTVMETVARQWLETAQRGAVLVDLTTNAPATVRRVGDRFAAAERHLLEAPLTGGAVGARARQVVFMVGGERTVYERCLPLLQTLGRATFYLGPLGAGNTAKLVNSLP